MDYKIRPITKEELKIPISWAAKEGWNPGIYDLDSFYKTDPNGFYMGFIGDEPVSSISAVAYDSTFGFLGFYIVKPKHRSKGCGIKIWNEALKHLPTQNIGLDGVLDQQANYKKSGFKLAYRNIRYEGVGSSGDVKDTNICLLSDINFQKLVEYDNQVFPATRPQFLKHWIKQPKSLAISYIENDSLSGYAVVRRCKTGYKIGPLFADTEKIAHLLYQRLSSFVGNKETIYLDVPEVNTKATKLAQTYKMKSIFETARMYTQQSPQVDLDKTYGVTTFELG